MLSISLTVAVRMTEWLSIDDGPVATYGVLNWEVNLPLSGPAEPPEFGVAARPDPHFEPPEWRAEKIHGCGAVDRLTQPSLLRVHEALRPNPRGIAGTSRPTPVFAGKVSVKEDSMAEDGVWGELVSAVVSLIHRENTGKFSQT